MVRGTHKNINDRSQCNLAPLEPSSLTIASPRFPNTPEKQDSELKSHFRKMIEAFKEDINTSLKKLQNNTGKKVEALKDKSLKQIHEYTIKLVKELNKVIQ
jgi:predicted phage gp36 major capsid-like protein